MTITLPADARLARDAEQALRPGAMFDARAIVFGREKVDEVVCGFEGQPWTAMERPESGPVWSARILAPEQPAARLTVRAVGKAGSGAHTIAPALGPPAPTRRSRTGSDVASIGAWPENGILGTQLGPNRNGRRW